jgi:hypothetical protein
MSTFDDPETNPRKSHGTVAVGGNADAFGLDFLPPELTAQCRSLVEGYHYLHGFGCLPDVLWRCNLGDFVKSEPQLRCVLKTASTSRSAKKSNEGFVQIATAILSMEILVSSFAGWTGSFPDAGDKARAMFKNNGLGSRTPLMDFYLRPPRLPRPPLGFPPIARRF